MLAIIIPYYKFTFLDATLFSLAEQTCQDFKVYVGDDASPENPVDLLKKYEGKFDFEYHRFHNNIGGISLFQQWERCIALTGNEQWLMILGDDDVLGKNVVEEFYKNLPVVGKEGINVVRFATQVIDGAGKSISGIYEHPKLEKATDSFLRKFKGKTRSSLSEYIFSRDSYLKVGFRDYPLAWHSDDMAWLEFADGNPILSINMAKTFIRVSTASISGKEDNLEQKAKATFMFYEAIANDYLSLFDKKQSLKILAKVESQFFKVKQKTLFFKIVKYHLKHTDTINLVKFFRRIYINWKTCNH